MNTTKFNKYLKKIKAFDNLVDDLSDLSLVEQDLLKDYIKKMYESVSELDNSDKIEKKHKKHKKSIETEKQEEVKEDKEEAQEEIIFVKPEAVEKTKQLPVDNTDDAKEQIVEDTNPSFKEDETVNASPEFLELFEINNGNELSQKLSQIPVKNLIKAFSINERIFTVKELFKGDKDSFEKVIGDLDKLTNLEEAKKYLVKNIIEKHGWDNPKMLKKVKGFVATVKRRYL